MKKKKKIVIVVILSLILLTFLLLFLPEYIGGKKYSVTEIKEILCDADEIVIKERIFAFNKSYQIFVNDEYIANVTGKYVNVTGEVLSLKNISGDLIAKEKQIKRWGVKLNRLAEVYDNEEKLTGYIGEEKIKDIFRIGYYFHFYDKDKDEIGTSDQVFSLLKKDIFYNEDKEQIYVVNKNFHLLKDYYTIHIKDCSDVSPEMAIFMTCIEDAINDSDAQKTKEKSKENNNK